MNLTTEDGTAIRDPTADELHAALDRLGLRGNGYAILEDSEQQYLQVAGSRADGYVAEYREGSEETHHSSAVSNLTHQQVLELLEAYRNGGSWKSMISWRRGMGAGSAGKSSTKAGTAQRTLLVLFFLIGAVSLGAAAYTAITTRQFLQHAVSVPGKVVRLSAWSYAPTVEYVDLTGHSRTLVSTSGTRPPSFFKGESVRVLYDPADPQFPLSAKIASFHQLWGGVIFGLIFCVAFWGAALVYWILALRPRRRPARPAA